jgi:hypothetical protein
MWTAACVSQAQIPAGSSSELRRGKGPSVTRETVASNWQVDTIRRENVGGSPVGYRRWGIFNGVTVRRVECFSQEFDINMRMQGWMECCADYGLAARLCSAARQEREKKRDAQRDQIVRVAK